MTGVLRAVRLVATGAGAILLLCGAAAFAVFPHRRGFDLLVPLADLLLGVCLLRWGRHPAVGRRRFALALLLAVAPIALLYGSMVTVHEIGEIVVLRTRDDRGGVRETRLAVLDYRGSTWLGADHGGRAWLQRLVSQSRVELLRAGRWQCYEAELVEDPLLREEVFRRIEEKYLVGRLTKLIGRPLFAREADPPEKAAKAVRLDPCSAGDLEPASPSSP